MRAPSPIPAPVPASADWMASAEAQRHKQTGSPQSFRGAPLARHARARPAHPRGNANPLVEGTFLLNHVDGRVKHGHDGERAATFSRHPR